MAESLSDTFVRALPDLSLIVRRDGVIIGNLGGRELGIDHEPNELRGTHLREIWTPGIAGQLHNVVRRVLKTRKPADHRYEHQQRQYEVRVRPQGVDRVLMVLRALPEAPVLLPLSQPWPPSAAVPSAQHDAPVATLDSREAFEHRLSVATANAVLREAALAVAVIQLGGLQEVEAAIGSELADGVMAATLDRLRVPRPILGLPPQRRIAAARYGNDVLAVLLDHFPGGDSLAVEVERIRRTLTEPVVYDERTFHLRPTLGVARFPEDGTQPQMLFEKARAAMSAALQSHRENLIAYYSDAPADRRTTPDLDRELRQALHRGEFAIRYAPTVELVGRRTESLEALVRWVHPACGPLPPEHFLPWADATDLGADIDGWVLEQACADLARLHGCGHARLRMAINIGRRMLDADDFPERVRQAANKAGVALAWLDLDVKERLLASGGPALEGLQILRERGVRVFADCCGNGSIALGRVGTLPIDGLKLDRRFVLELERDPSARAICTSVVAIAQAFGLRSVATGIETTGQLDFLRECRCDAAQGFLFSAPQPLDHFLVCP